MDPLLWLVLAATVAIILLAISLIRGKRGADKEKAGTYVVVWIK